MADRFPLIVDGSGTPAIKEIVSGDVLDLTGTTIKAVSVDTTLAVAGASTLTGNTTIGGTLGVTGAATFNSSVTSTGLIAGSLLNASNNTLSILSGGNATNAGANLSMYGGAASSGAGDFRFRSGTNVTAMITAAGVFSAASLDISGDVDVDGTTNLDVVDIDGAVNMATTLLVTGVATASTSAKITQVPLATSGSTISWDSAAAANAYLVPSVNLTIDLPTNPIEGAIISVEIAQGGTPYTVAWNTVFEFAASTAPTVTATANKTDIFSFRYNGSVWQEIGRVQNLAQT